MAARPGSRGSGARGQGPGDLILIGGHEEKGAGADASVLDAVAERADGGPLLVLTTAAHDPEKAAAIYGAAFRERGVRDVDTIDVRARAEAYDDALVARAAAARAYFLTGGDPVRLTSQLGGTPLFQRVYDNWRAGAPIAGTSAGALTQSEAMIVHGSDQRSHEIAGVRMAPGFGLVHGAVIDVHFAERGRLPRLLGAIAHCPRHVGIGIDEDAAVIVAGRRCTVLGSSAVYVVDAHALRWSNLDAKQATGVLSAHGFVVHVLAAGGGFDLDTRTPLPPGDGPASEAGPR